MSLVKRLLEKEKHLKLPYYGLYDMSTGFDMKIIVENKDIIIDYYKENHNAHITTFDQYIEYHFASKIIKMKEVIPNIIDEDKKENFTKIVKTVEEYFDTITISDVIKYINNNYETIFSKDYSILGIIDVTISFFSKCISGIKEEVMEFLILNHPYLIVNHYDIFSITFEKNEKLSNLFWSETVISSIFLQQQKQIQKILQNLYLKGKFKNFESVLDVLSNIIEEKYFEIDNQNILANETYIRNFYEFLSSIKHVKANKFREYYDKTCDKMDEYLKENGYHSSYEIPVEEIVKYFKKIEPKEYSLLFVSHTNKDAQILSRLEESTNKERSLVDLVSTNYKTDNHYTVSHIHKLGIISVVGACTIHGLILDDEMFDETKRNMIGYLLTICKIKEFDSDGYSNDVEMLYQMLNILREAHKIENEDLLKSICFGTCSLIFGIMEKILRDIYICENKNLIYLDTSQITIGQLIRDDSGIIGKIFGKNQLKHLRYYLSTDTEQKIGFNYRNSIAHYTIDKEQLNVSLVMKMLYLLIDIINSIFIYLHAEIED